MVVLVVLVGSGRGSDDVVGSKVGSLNAASPFVLAAGLCCPDNREAAVVVVIEEESSHMTCCVAVCLPRTLLGFRRASLTPAVKLWQ